MILRDTDIDKILPFLAEQESQEIRSPNEYILEIQSLAKYGNQQQGEYLPWENSQNIFRLRPSELTIWAGINGHGKSMLLGQVILWSLKHSGAIIASLEMKPSQTLLRMSAQYAGCKPSPGYIPCAVQAMQQKNLWIYDQLAQVQPERIIAMCYYAAYELKVRNVVIDSLAKCGIAEDDYKGQKNFVDRLQWAAKRFCIHIHLVCHMRKPKSEYEEIGKMDIKGTGAITDLADNVIVITRNKKKEQAKAKENMGAELSKNDLKYLEQRDCYVSIEKNRHGGEEGSFGLYFNKESFQYTTLENKTMLSPF